MKYIIKRKDNLNLSNWSGGSTTELFIFPENAHYRDRDFEIRISSATINETPSIFTLLPNYRRLLMPINAPLKLVFDEKNECILNPFEAVEFEGAGKTTSHSACVDIGIMLSANWSGKICVAGNGICRCEPGFTGVYAISDNIKINIDNEKHILMNSDFLILETEIADAITLALPDKNTAIITHVIRIK